MAKSIDAVIAALRIVLEEAETQQEWESFDVVAVNRWVAMLPGAWRGRWRSFDLAPDYSSEAAYRETFIAHVRATLAYLENYHDAPPSRRFWSRPFKRSASQDGDSNVIDLPSGKRH